MAVRKCLKTYKEYARMSYVGRCAAISQVMSTLAELAKSQIGRSNCIKCVVAEDGIHSDMFQCSAHLLRNLDIEHPVYNVINSVVQSHHTAHGNCCKTLLVMAGLWYQEMEQLVELGLSIGEISTVFEKGLEASVDHLLHSSAVQLLNDDFSLTSGEDVSYGCSASFEGYREDISSRPENEVSAVPSNSFECDKKFGSHMVDRQSLAEDEDVGWFFQGESRDPSSLDSFDREKTIFTEDTNSNFAVDCTHLPSQDCKLLRDSDDLTEKLNNTQICSNPTDASLFQCLEIEDEFEDCFSDSIFGLRESETRLAINDSCQASLTLNHDERKSSNDISDQNYTNLVLLNEGINSEMFHKKVDSNSKVTQEFSSQCGNAENSTLCSGACHVMSKDKIEDLLDCENTVKCQMVIGKTEDFGFENTAKFQLGHSDLVEKDILPTSNTIFEKAKHACSKCVLTTDCPACHCANDTSTLAEPDCLILLQDIAPKALNCPPTPANTPPFHTSSFNFINKYSRHSLAISSPEDSEQHHTTESKQNTDDDLQHQFISSQNGLGLCVNSSAGDHLKASDCKSLIAANKNSCKSADCGILTSVETSNCEKRVGSGAAMGSSNVKTSDSYGLLNMQSRFNHETAFYDVIQDCEENTFCQDGIYETVFEQRLAILGSKLSHGADDMMKLVVKMAYQQLKDNGPTRLERDLIHTCCLDGIAEDKTCIVEGLLIPIAVDQIPLIVGEHDSRKARRALLLNGDLTTTFCHQGYRKVTKVTRIRKTVSETESKSEIWLNQVMKVIEQLDVGVLFVKGSVDGNLLYRCLHQNVVVFEGVSYRALSALSLCTDAPLNLYVGDCTECCVAQGVELQLWMCERVRIRESMKHLSYVTVNVPLSPLPVQTAVVCHPVASVTHVKEEQLLHCAHRLCSTLTTRKVLMGGGTAEAVCAVFLEQSADDLEKVSSSETDLVTATIYRSMARGFRHFVDIIRNNIDNSTVPFDQMIYDDCDSKLETWRTALCLVTLLLRCDMEIVAKTPKPSQDLVIGYL